jgi:hypothetical protein
MTLFKRPVFLLPLLIIPAVAFANEEGFMNHPDLDPIGFLATLAYGLLGIGLAMFGYKVYSWMVPFDLNKEIEVDQNPAVGLVLGSVIIGVSIIVAASIH